uniref:2OG-Fe dioxygenase family protein n=1 Tax=Odontella aurita TaxID=265563 RepID=A0A7S4MB09_9STRA|mmetsp:Transcript_16290/g.46935  ORF Transcript_16290/g.46935 Transcript_16290/m.46935 type:complete len:282 (+) Transcript_16290:3-848(+)
MKETAQEDDQLADETSCPFPISSTSTSTQLDQSCLQPSFEFSERFLSSDVCKRVMQKVDLGLDPSSEHFAERHKAIRFVTVINRRVQCFSQDYFVQNEDYNDFSGGYKRHYKLIEEDACIALQETVLKFTDYYSIPEKTVILLQIQTSIVKTQHKMRRESVTGQGIHTDGADHALLVCLHRGSGVEGAMNQFHANLDGSEPLCEPKILEQGTAAFFKDNELYHHVSPICLNEAMSSSEKDGNTRTILLLHSPAEIYMQGFSNKLNLLTRRDSAVKLRRSSV